MRCRRGRFFVDPGEQPGLNRSVRPLSLRIVIGETARLEDYGAQLGDAAAPTVVEVQKRKAGSGHRILQERDRQCPRQAMLAAQMQKSADKAVAAIPVIMASAFGSNRPQRLCGSTASNFGHRGVSGGLGRRNRRRCFEWILFAPKFCKA